MIVREVRSKTILCATNQHSNLIEINEQNINFYLANDICLRGGSPRPCADALSVRTH